MSAALRRFFGPGRKIIQASAPARMDVMGGFGDYSGSWVLQMPLGQRTTVYLSLREDCFIYVHSVTADQAGLSGDLQTAIPEIFGGRKRIDYAKVRSNLEKYAGCEWAGYVIGCPAVLAKEKGLPLSGFDLWIESEIPLGKGISSSAALEVSVMAALTRALGLRLGRKELPRLAQKVENEVVDAPCGLMDQLVCYLGRKDHLLPILCQPDQTSSPIPLPKGIHFVGLDSGVEHSVGAKSYTSVRTAAFMGSAMIAVWEGATKKDIERAKRTRDGSNLPYSGYLSNIAPSVFEREYRLRLPEACTGKTFKQKYGITTDPATEPKDRVRYAVRSCVAHPVYENHRVRTFALLVKSLNQNKPDKIRRRETLKCLGELMAQAHQSYSACGLGHEVTDALVAAVREEGPLRGVYGAKITGGGSGGAVCVLCEGRKGLDTAKAIGRRVAEEYGYPARFFIGSSDGTRKSGTRIL